MSFKSLVPGAVCTLGTVDRVKVWADGSRTVRFTNGRIMTRKGNANPTV